MSNHVVLPGYILARQVYELSYLNGIQEKITETNKISADFIENGGTNKVVTSTDIANWNAKVSHDELSAQSYVTSAQLDLASYISSFEESDPTVPAYVKSITENDIANWNAVQSSSSIPTKLSDLTNDVSYITQAELSANAYLTEHQSLDAYPTKAELSAQSYLKAIPPEYVTQAELSANGYLTSHQDLTTYAKKSDAIGSLSLSLDSTNYKVTLSGTKVDGTAFTVDNVIDLPLESVVVSGYYDSTNKKVALTLENGSVVDFSVADLVNGLQSEITISNKLSSDLIDDTNKTHKFVTSADIDSWNKRVTKAELSAQAYLQSIPSEYITQAELSANAYLTEHQSLDAYPTKAELSAQAYLQSIPSEYITQAELSANAYLTEHQSLDAYPTKAELSAQGYLQSFTETDPVFLASAAHGITSSDISSWNEKISKEDLVSQSYVTSDQLSAQSYAGYSYVYSAYAYIIDQIVDNELVIAAALTETNERIINLENAGYLTSFTESDPTVPAYVKSITEANISNWNDKVSKAELSAQGYLTSESDPTVPTYVKNITEANISSWNSKLDSEQDPVFTASAAHDITSSDINSWNDKVSKTELSAQGYITSIPSEYITQAELSANAYLTEHQSLDAYPTKAELSAQAYLKAVPDEYVTQAELSANGYLTAHQDLTTYAKKSDAIGSLSLSLDSSNYKITLSGTKVDGTAFTVSNVIDLPLESVVVSGYYDNTNKKVVLTLENGSVVDFSVADLVAGLQSEITSSNKLSADLVQDGSTNKVVTVTEKADWNSRVTKAELSAQAYLTSHAQHKLTIATGTTTANSGNSITFIESLTGTTTATDGDLTLTPTKKTLTIPAEVTESTVSGWGFTKNTGTLTSESDPVFTASAAHGITSTDISNWNAKVSKSDLSAQAYLTAHAKHKLTIATGTTTANSGNSITFIESLTGTTTATDGDLTLTPTKKTITIPSAVTESIVSGWGFTKNAAANNATITIQKGGTTVDSFTTDASSNKTINIPNELPSYSSSDSGKVLSVNSSGQLVWITPVSIYTGSGTPSNSIGNNGDIYLQS